MILFVESADAGGGDTEFFDFSVGFPRRRLFEHVESESDLWIAYVHLRLAWESAGNPATVVEILSNNEFNIGDDNAFEARLNEYANERLEAINTDDRDELKRFLGNLAGACMSPHERLQFKSHLLSKQLLWCPLGQSESQVVPWAARAMALKEYDPNVAMILRYANVALPLVTETLGKCFELEARERSLYWPMRRGSQPPVEIEREHMRFVEGLKGASLQLYPDAAPQVLDPWCFASMGNFFSGLPKDSCTEYRQRVKLVRNALSHGHNVSWSMLKLLRAAENALLATNRSLPYELRSTVQKTHIGAV
jgi:hypothetical protein